MASLSLHQDIDEFRKRTLENSVVAELSVIEEGERKQKLNHLLGESNEKSKTKTDEKEELKEMFDVIEKQMHMQPWNKLQQFYKIEKVNEFCKNKMVPENVQLKIINLIEEGHLTGKYVEYNQSLQQIDNIILLIKNPADEYTLDENKVKKLIKGVVKKK